MSAIFQDQGLPACFGFSPGGLYAGFSFFEQAQIEIPAPEKYHIAQKWREFQLRDVGPDWFQWNSMWAHRFYIDKREWWRTFV